MVAAMYERRSGYYKDYGEAQFASWEGTTTSGTSTSAIASTLNNHFSSFGHWKTHKATDRYDYMSYVMVNTYSYHQSVPQSVDTEYLPYFNGKALNHINMLYGFTTSTSPDYVSIAEEWDPVYIYGGSTYGNPYGHHTRVRLLYAFQAEDHTSYHMMVV